MLTEQQVEEMKEQITHNYKELRKYHIQKLLDYYGLTAGCKIKLDGKLYQLLDFDNLCEYNDLRSFYPYLYGRKIKVDGNLHKNVQTIYIFRNSNVEIVG